MNRLACMNACDCTIVASVLHASLTSPYIISVFVSREVCSSVFRYRSADQCLHCNSQSRTWSYHDIALKLLQQYAQNRKSVMCLSQPP